MKSKRKHDKQGVKETKIECLINDIKKNETSFT